MLFLFRTLLESDSQEPQGEGVDSRRFMVNVGTMMNR